MAELSEVERLYLRNAAVIKGFVRALLPDAEAAEDVFQEVYLTVRSKADNFRSGSDFMAWVRAIARLHVLRARPRPCRWATTIENLAEDGDDFVDDWEEQRLAMRLCLQQVQPRARELLQLRFVRELPPRRIAEQLQRSVNGVSAALSQALRTLRHCTERRLRTDGRDAAR